MLAEEFGIFSEVELTKALKMMGKLSIGAMTAPVGRKEKVDGKTLQASA